MLFFGSNSLAQLDSNGSISLNGVFNNDSGDNADLYFNQHSGRTIETPDLKMGGESFVYGVATPSVITPQTLGAIMGGLAANQDQNRKEIVEYLVQAGDTIESVANSFGVSINTLLWANDLSKNSILKTGQTLVILPVDGILHIVKSGDTIEDIAKKYKAKAQDIIDFNGFSDIFIGDIVMVPGGVMPQQKAPVSISVGIGTQNVLPDSFFIPPLLKFKITQGLHYLNGVDFSSPDGCGSAVYASASGTVQRAVSNGGWNAGKGNHITIAHANGVSTYYGHLMSLFVKPGDVVSVGDRIGLEGKTGKTTGCHVHWQVMGAKNPFAKYPVGYSQ